MFRQLYKDAANGKKLIWEISVEKNKLTKKSYYEKSEKIKISTVEVFGKNKNKSNETSNEEQAVLEAERCCTKKIKYEKYYSNYNLNIKSEVIEPMLCKDITWKEKWLNEKCFIQPKLDGIRCMAKKIDNEWKLFSRKGNEFPFLNHIKISLECLNEDFIFDGELYIHNSLHQDIAGMVSINRLIAHKTENKIEYHIFDIVSKEKQYERFEILKSINFLHPLFFVIPEEVNCIEEIKEVCKKYSDYEGCIVRKFDIEYIHKRTDFVKKIKSMDSTEFEIVNFKDGVGLDKNKIIFVCKTEKGIFDCRPSFDFETRKEMFSRGDQYINKKITVQHQGLTKQGIPRFPVGISIRDYE